MYWLRTSYKDWANKQGIDINKDDFKFIEKTLNKIPENLHKSIMKSYSEKWLECMDDNEKSSQNQNKGRFMANSWLLEKLE